MVHIDCSDELGGFENTRLWSTTLKQATKQLLLCYRRKPSESAVCCPLRLNSTTTFQILLRSSVYTQTLNCTQERKKMPVNVQVTAGNETQETSKNPI